MAVDRCRGLKIRIEKIDFIVVGRVAELEEGVILDDFNLLRVDSFKSLGTRVNKDGMMDREIYEGLRNCVRF